jgi:hypothetical protein
LEAGNLSADQSHVDCGVQTVGSGEKMEQMEHFLFSAVVIGWGYIQMQQTPSRSMLSFS